MERKYRIISAELISVSRPQFSRKHKKEYKLLSFRNLDNSDVHSYVLCAISGNTSASRFLRFPVGTKLAGLVTYLDKDKYYISTDSNFSIIKARPLF